MAHLIVLITRKPVISDFVEMYGILKLENEERKCVLFIGLFLLILNVPRERSLWMHPRTDAWFRLADEHFTERQWYENFRVTN